MMVNTPLATPSRSSTNWTIPQPRGAGIPTMSPTATRRPRRKQFPAPFGVELDDLTHPVIEPDDHPHRLAYDILIAHLWASYFEEQAK